MRRRHVWHNGAWVDVTNVQRPPRKTPYLIRDGMAPVMHPATGEMFDSKSAFRAVNKAQGLVELGNDLPPPAPPPATVTAAEIAEAWNMVEQGYAPPPTESVSDWSEAETRIIT